MDWPRPRSGQLHTHGALKLATGCSNGFLTTVKTLPTFDVGGNAAPAQELRAQPPGRSLVADRSMRAIVKGGLRRR
jgi:hypothetical protein